MNRLIPSLICAACSMQAGDAAPAPTHIVGMDYPILAHVSGVQGAVRLSLVIDSGGNVSAVELVSGPPVLAVPTIENLKKWSFSACSDPSGKCRYPISVEYIMWGDPINIDECKTTFEFFSPGRVVIRSQKALAIID